MTVTEKEARTLAYGAAFNEGLRQIMEEDPDVFFAGEDVGKAGGVFGSFVGLNETFGDLRAVDTPISEQAIVGLGIGAAVTGLRPVVDVMFMDFMFVAMDQIANQAAKLKYMFGGKATLPLTITTSAGAGLSAAAQHSQSLEAMLCHIPGLKVVMPSNPYDAKGLLVACIRDNNPTVYVKNKRLLGLKGEVPEDLYEVPIGVANIVRPGSSVTVVTYGRMVQESLKAAEELAGEGVDCEVIDLRVINPLDVAPVVESVSSTRRLVVAEGDWRSCGIAAEVIAGVLESVEAGCLVAPPQRINIVEAPAPTSAPLEAAYYPTVDDLCKAVRRTVA